MKSNDYSFAVLTAIILAGVVAACLPLGANHTGCIHRSNRKCHDRNRFNQHRKRGAQPEPERHQKNFRQPQPAV